MSEKVLSQDEVDSLLKGVASGEIDTDDAKDTLLSGERKYDFTNQERIVRGRMPGLEMANESFTRLFRNSVSNLIMKYVDISIQNLEIIKFGDFIKTMPVPSSINIFKMNPLKGYSLLVLEAPLVFAFIEYFFGGANAQNIKSEGRAFTTIEQRIIQKVVNMALTDIKSSWDAIADIEPEYVSSEINPQFVTIVTPGEIVINIEVLLEIEDFAGKLFFCIPYSTIEPVKDKIYSGIQGDRVDADQRWTLIMKQVLKETYVEVTAELGRLSLTFDDIMKFKVGSVLSLGKSAADGLLVKVEGLPKYKGTAGSYRGTQAVKLTEIIE